MPCRALYSGSDTKTWHPNGDQSLAARRPGLRFQGCEQGQSVHLASVSIRLPALLGRARGALLPLLLALHRLLAIGQGLVILRVLVLLLALWLWRFPFLGRLLCLQNAMQGSGNHKGQESPLIRSPHPRYHPAPAALSSSLTALPAEFPVLAAVNTVSTENAQRRPSNQPALCPRVGVENAQPRATHAPSPASLSSLMAAPHSVQASSGASSLSAASWQRKAQPCH